MTKTEIALQLTIALISNNMACSATENEVTGKITAELFNRILKNLDVED